MRKEKTCPTGAMEVVTQSEVAVHVNEERRASPLNGLSRCTEKTRNPAIPAGDWAAHDILAKQGREEHRATVGSRVGRLAPAIARKA
jgi:hypothetical protein